MSRSGYYIRYFTQPVPGPWHGTNRWAGLRGGADSSGQMRVSAEDLGMFPGSQVQWWSTNNTFKYFILCFMLINLEDSSLLYAVPSFSLPP